MPPMPPTLLTSFAERQAAPCYNDIRSSELPEPIRNTLAEVFINWLEQRFGQKGKLEIEKMLVGQLPDLRETQSGKDLIAIGKAEGLIKLLEIRFAEVPAALREGIQKVDSDERIDSLYELALKISKLSDFKL